MTIEEKVSENLEQKNDIQKTFPKKIYIVLLIVIAFATSMRLLNAVSRLPYVYHPDEPLNIKIIQTMFKKRTLNPKMLNYPSLYFYINVAAYYPYYYLGKALDAFSQRSDIKRLEMQTLAVAKSPQPSNIFLGRMVTVIFSVATVFLVYKIGKDITGNIYAGLLSAFMTAICPTLIQNSGYITPDTFVGFFAMLTLFGSFLIFKHGLTRYYILAGIAAGLTISCKYNGAIILITILAAHFLKHGIKGFKDFRIYLALGLSIIAFILTTPYAILDFERFKKAVEFERLHYSVLGHPGARSKPFIGYFSYLWRTKGIVSIVALAGIITGFYRRRKEIILLSVFPLTYFLFVGRMVTQTNRTLLPMLPFLFLLSAIFIVETHKWIRTRPLVSQRMLFTGLTLLVAISLIFPFVNSVTMTVESTLPDSREKARMWIEENIPEGAGIAIEGYTTYLDRNKFKVKGLDRIVDKSYDWYVEEGYEYIVFSSRMHDRYFREKEIYAKRVAAYLDFFNRLDLITQFEDSKGKISIYRIPAEKDL